MIQADPNFHYANAMLGEMPQPSRCQIAYHEYQRQELFSNLFTAIWFALVASTVVFLVAALALLAWLLSQWADDTLVNNAIKSATTVVSAAGAFVTGTVVADHGNSPPSIIETPQVSTRAGQTSA